MTDEGDQYGVNFIRLRVAVDIQKPLCRGRTIITARGKEGWVNFRYERLPNICYWCGKLTHGDRECPLWIRSRGTLKDGDQQFGAWLRATTPNPFKKTVIRVPGLDEEDGWNDFEMHGEKDTAESSSKEVGGRGSVKKQNRVGRRPVIKLIRWPTGKQNWTAPIHGRPVWKVRILRSQCRFVVK